MTYFFLRKAGDQQILFDGEFDTLKGCIEEAIRRKIVLDYVDLRGANLMNVDMDEGSFNFARFDHANLTGANMSATSLKKACFKNATLYNTCFCEAVLADAQFFGACFGGTDIAWADLSGACFDTISALELKFSDALMVKGALFYDRTGTVCSLSHPPVIVSGLQYPIILFDDHMKVGSAVLPYITWDELRQSRGGLKSGRGFTDVYAHIRGFYLYSFRDQITVMARTKKL